MADEYELDDDMKACMEAGDEDVECEDEGEDAADDIEDGPCMLEERDEGDEALQKDHLLDPGKFHVGVKWVHLAYLTGRREKYNGEKFMVVSFGVRDPAKVKVKSAKRNENNKFIYLWVKRVNCRNTVHKDSGAWKATENATCTGATGAARWVALGRSEVDQMQGKLKFKKTAEEEAARNELFNLMDVNGNGFVSLAELDKALPDLMGCVALFNAKPAIIRAFLAATDKEPERTDDGAFNKYAEDYCYPGEQFRLLLQYLHEFFEMYIIFQDMVDADDDRRISCEEFAEFIYSRKAEKVGIVVTDEMLEDRCGSTIMPGYSLFNQIDEDQGGCILFKEFSDYCIRKGIKDSKGGGVDSEMLKQMFDGAKDLPDGMSMGKFYAILTEVGVSPADIGQMISDIDTNKNYKIDPGEFIEWLMMPGMADAFQSSCAGE